MKAIILAAGYATRLYPLTKNQPKPLLKVGDRTILDHIVAKMDQISQLDEIYIVTNAKFTGHFKKWVDQASYQTPLTVINDGTVSNGDRLGALGDIHFVIQEEKVQDDLLVVAGDNLFGFELTDLATYFEEVGENVIALYKEDDSDQLIRGGTADIDDRHQVVGFEEKPKKVNYPYSVPTFYIFKEKSLPFINQYIAEGNDSDANGNFIPYLLNKVPVYGFVFNEYRYDIGTLASYEKVQKKFNWSLNCLWG